MLDSPYLGTRLFQIPTYREMAKPQLSGASWNSMFVLCTEGLWTIYKGFIIGIFFISCCWRKKFWHTLKTCILQIKKLNKEPLHFGSCIYFFQTRFLCVIKIQLRKINYSKCYNIIPASTWRDWQKLVQITNSLAKIKSELLPMQVLPAQPTCLVSTNKIILVLWMIEMKWLKKTIIVPIRVK
jgi:hypothetical protein